MKDTSTELKAAFTKEVATLANIWRIERLDGVILGFTDHVENILYDSITYKAATGFSRSALDNKVGLAVDNMDIQGILDSSDITEEDILAGKYQGAEVYHAELDYTETAWGVQKYDLAIMGRITLHDGKYLFEAEVRSITSLLDQEVGDKYTRYCPHRLGESETRFNVEIKCGIELSPTTWQAEETVTALDARSPVTYNGRRFVCTTDGITGLVEPTWDTIIGNTTTDGTAEWTAYDAYKHLGQVTAVTSKQKFQDVALLRDEDDFQYGEIEFTSGLNNGLKLQVKANDNAGNITLLFPAPFTISVTDTFVATVGCNHLLRMSNDEWGTAYTGHCRTKFNTEDGGNAENFGGECEIPGNDAALSIV